MDQPESHDHTQNTLHGDIECQCGFILVPNEMVTSTDITTAKLEHLIATRLTEHQRQANLTGAYTADGEDASIFDADILTKPDVLIITESFAQITAAIAGYRAQLIGHGFPEEAAIEMSVDYHRSFIAHIFAGMANQS